ncbi:uncharacterized protein N0V96_001781 [Colletotrichum fioriniae]|uniref:uncharacterized protein n=1 Tax=Colletotrichum fioriniae TaxID=710243 RepID=UPI0032DA3D4E|nr:hypothetical protein N0V96_001781 [Colletotrichum fioriniae]
MTTTPAGKAVRPRLNTTTNWSLPRDQAGRPDPEELSPLSPGRAAGEYGWGQQKGSHGHGNRADEQQQQQQGCESLTMETLTSKPRDSLGSMPSDMLEELRKIIKEEVAQLGFPPLSSQNPAFTPAYPSPPPSVIDAGGASKTSSPRDRSPEFAHAKPSSAPPPPHQQQPPPTTVPVSAPQSTPPISPQQRGVHFRKRASPVIHCQPRVETDNEDEVSPTAPASPRVELSSVDKAWGVLFDSEGYPTNRLNSVLRGLATFMVTEFGSPDTLVVTPEKMLMLYTKYKVEPERFQYEGLGPKDALERIEFLYQDLDCQYHLVQAAPRSHPNIPGLTPAGFAKWMISNILAYPDLEARRLHAIMTALPINADGPLLNDKPERLPRQLSRHLFPEIHDKKVRKITDEAMWDCLEDVAPPLPSIPKSRPAPLPQDVTRLPEANTHTRRSGSDLPKRPASLPHRSRTYDRGAHRVEPHPARLPRANSDAGVSLPRHPESAADE